MNDAGLTLRDRLRMLRQSALARLAEGHQLDEGLLALAAHASTALAAIDAEAVESALPGSSDRAVVLDDNLRITVAVFTADRQAAAAVLSPLAAMRLAWRCWMPPGRSYECGLAAPDKRGVSDMRKQNFEQGSAKSHPAADG
jgi:hypothetical protein